MTRWVLALVLISGCAAAPGSACVDAPPAIDDCDRGIAWADCGGVGTGSRFACQGSDCRWFANDCVARGYEPSSCPVGDMCCHANTAYEGGLTGSMRDFGVSALALGWGTQAWDRARDRDLSVTVGTTAVATRPSIDCDGAGALLAGSACGSPMIRASAGERGGVVIGGVSVDGATFGGRTITLELIPDATGAMAARVCSVPFSDAATGTCSDAAVSPRGCATSGAVRIDAMPVTAETHIDVDATFEDGSTIAIRI